MGEVGAASAATGFISLGLELCKGVYKYCDSLKNHERDTGALNLQADHLEGLLEELDHILPQREQGDSGLALARIRSFLVDCGTALRDLNAKLRKYSPGKSQGPLQRALYPLVKSDIAALEAIAANLRQLLQLALLVYQVTTDAHGRIEQQRMCSMIQGLHQAQPMLLAIMNDGFQQMKDMQLEVRRELEQLKISQRAQESESPCPQMLSPQEAHEAGSLQERNSVDAGHAENEVREAVDGEIVRFAAPALEGQVLAPRKAWRTLKCRCRPNSRVWRWDPISFLSFRTDSTSRHKPSCPYYGAIVRTYRQSVRVQNPWSSGWRVTGTQIVLTTIVGAGNHCISQALSCRRVVDLRQLCRNLFSVYGDVVDLDLNLVSDRVSQLRKDLYSSMAEGRLSPTDVTPDGDTLFGNPASLEQSMLLLHEMIDAGCPVDDGDESGRSILNSTARCSGLGLSASGEGKTALASVCLAMIERGAKQPDDLAIFDGVVGSSSQVIEVLELSRFARALLHRSLPLLFECLTSEPSCVQERFTSANLLHFFFSSAADLESSLGTVFCGSKTCLEAATGWPAGLETLLSSAGDFLQLDSLWMYSLGLSVGLGNYAEPCFKSAKLLLEYGCPINSAARIVSTCFKNDDLEGGCRWTALLIPQVVNRRQRLKELALAHLQPEESIVALLKKTRVLDTLALETYDCLRKHGVHVPEALQIDRSNPIYSRALTRRQAETLWAYGFRDLESVPFRTRGPVRWSIFDDTLNDSLPRSDFWLSLELAEWAVQHGAMTAHGNGSLKIRKLLSLAWKVGRGIAFVEIKQRYTDQVPLEDCPNTLLPFLRHIFEPEVTDGCQCHCTAQGCDGIALAMRSFLRKVQWRWRLLGPLAATPRVKWSSKLPRRFHEFVTFLLELFDVDSEDFGWVARGIVRWLAFELTEQRHTCCTRNHSGEQNLPYLEQDLIDEIHEEHREELQQFEDLVTRLTLDLDARGPDEKEFMDFVHGTFRRRIGEWFYPSTNDDDSDDGRAGYGKAWQGLDIRVDDQPDHTTSELWQIICEPSTESSERTSPCPD